MPRASKAPASSRSRKAATPARKGGAKKTTAKKGTVKRGGAKKATVKRGAAKKTAVKKGVARKVTSKKSTAKKATTKKATTKKATARKQAPKAASRTARISSRAKSAKSSKSTTTARRATQPTKATRKTTTARTAKTTTTTKPTAAPTKARARKRGAPLDKFLEGQRTALLEERDTYLRQAETLKAEADALAEDMEPGDVQFDEESGEGDTINVERERDLALSAQARAAVEEIDRALEKIDDGTYGICEQCGEPIPKERLRALPYAALCVRCKSGGLGRR